MKTGHRIIFRSLWWLLIFSLAGCSGLYGKSKSHYASSTVEYLYPNREVIEAPSIPLLSLPIAVGVAFVPDSGSLSNQSRLSEKDKFDLMNRIASEFKSLDFVKKIEIIPSAYLTGGGGFTNLDQIKTMYGIDVIALLSFDQVQHTDEGFLSLSYWTIVGAYIIRGEKNDTNTMIDAAVYDIASRKMLFRAPGTDHIKSSATLVNLSEKLREDSLQGFHKAADDLVGNVREELDRFKANVREKPEEYVVQYKPGYKGGAAMDGIAVLILLGLTVINMSRGKKP
jgi:rhombotail lipoprotein